MIKLISIKKKKEVAPRAYQMTEDTRKKLRECRDKTNKSYDEVISEMADIYLMQLELQEKKK